MRPIRRRAQTGSKPRLCEGYRGVTATVACPVRAALALTNTVALIGCEADESCHTQVTTPSREATEDDVQLPAPGGGPTAGASLAEWLHRRREHRPRAQREAACALGHAHLPQDDLTLGLRRRLRRSARAGVVCQAEVLRPQRHAVGRHRSAGTGDDIRGGLDVRAVAGRLQPRGEHCPGGREPHGDVLTPATRVPASRDTLGRASGDRRRRIVVSHVAVGRHVPRLPHCRGRERRRHLQGAQPQRRSMLVDEPDHAVGERRVRRAEVGAGGAVTGDGSGRTERHEHDKSRDAGREQCWEGPNHEAGHRTSPSPGVRHPTRVARVTMRPGGFEPPTNGLEGRRSSTELRARSVRVPRLLAGD